MGYPPLIRTKAISQSPYLMRTPFIRQEVPRPQPVWSPPEPPEREPPSQARPPPLPPVAAFRHPVLHACGAHPTDPPSRGYDSRLKDTLLCGPARRLDVPAGKHGTRGPRRADDGSVSRAPAAQARAPPARSVGRGAATSPSARSPRARGGLTYPKHPKWPPGEDRFVFLRNGPLPGAVVTATLSSRRNRLPLPSEGRGLGG